MTGNPHVSPWTPMRDPVDLKHLGKLLEELAELVEVATAYLMPRGMASVETEFEDELADVMAAISLVERRFGLSIAGNPETWGPITADDGLIVTLIARLALASKVAARCVIQGMEGRDPQSGQCNSAWLERCLRRVVGPIGRVIDGYGLDRDHIVARAITKMARLRAWHAMPVRDA